MQWCSQPCLPSAHASMTAGKQMLSPLGLGASRETGKGSLRVQLTPPCPPCTRSTQLLLALLGLFLLSPPRDMQLLEIELKRVFTGTGLSIHVELVARVAFTVEGAGGAHTAVLASVVPFHAHVYPWKAERASEQPPRCSPPTLPCRETHRADCQHTYTGTSTFRTGF